MCNFFIDLLELNGHYQNGIAIKFIIISLILNKIILLTTYVIVIQLVM